MCSIYIIFMQYRNDFFLYLIFVAISYFNIVVLYLNKIKIKIISIYTQIANYETKIKNYNDLFVVISYTCEPTGFYSKSESSSESSITLVSSTSIALSHRDLHPQALVHFRLLRQHVHTLQLLHLQLRHSRTGLGAGVLFIQSMEMLFTFTLQPCPCGGK